MDAIERHFINREKNLTEKIKLLEKEEEQRTAHLRATLNRTISMNLIRMMLAGQYSFLTSIVGIALNHAHRVAIHVSRTLPSSDIYRHQMHDCAIQKNINGCTDPEQTIAKFKSRRQAVCLKEELLSSKMNCVLPCGIRKDLLVAVPDSYYGIIKEETEIAIGGLSVENDTFNLEHVAKRALQLSIMIADHDQIDLQAYKLLLFNMNYPDAWKYMNPEHAKLFTGKENPNGKD